MLSDGESGRDLPREAAIGVLRQCMGRCRDLVMATGEVEALNKPRVQRSTKGS
jgi:hypothetical protein